MPKKSAMWGKWMQKKCIICFLHRNDDRQVKENSKCYILNKSFHTKTCHSPANARCIVANNLHVDRGMEGIDKAKNRKCRHRIIILRTSEVCPLVPSYSPIGITVVK